MFLRKQKYGKRQKNDILYNFICFIGATVKVHTDDISDKSAIFRMTETLVTLFKKLKEVFNKEKYLRYYVGQRKGKTDA